MTRKLFVIAMVFTACVLSQAISGIAEEGGPPPVREIPGITAEDMFPNGCVDCHTVRQDIGRDVRISTIMKDWGRVVDQRFLAMAQSAAPKGVKLTGKHPAVTDNITDIPAGCLIGCHNKSSKTTPPFSRMMHVYHLTGGDRNPYLIYFQGECTHCHKLNKETGEFFVPSGTEKPILQ